MTFRIKQLIPKPPVENVTVEEKKILQIVTRGNKYQLDLLMHTSKEKIEKLVQGYYERRPFIDKLKKNNIPINDLDDLQFTGFHKYYIQVLPIFKKWISDNNVPIEIKSHIIHICLNNAGNYKEFNQISKETLFDLILDIYKNTKRFEFSKEKPLDVSLLSMDMSLGNAITRWADDDHAVSIFALYNDPKNKNDYNLLNSFPKFKHTKNKKKAIEIVMRELQQQELKNRQIANLIVILRKLNAVDAKDVIFPFIEFPKNYNKKKLSYYLDYKRRRVIERDSATDIQVRNEAKKAIAKFDKIKNAKTDK